jgi:hypothetical protein
MAEAADVIEVPPPRNNDARRHRPSSRSRKNRIKKPREVFSLDSKIVQCKHPTNQAKNAPVYDTTLLNYEILYNGGQRTAQILEKYPDLLNAPSFGVPPIGAAVYMNDLASAAVLLDKGVDLTCRYAYNTTFDRYHAFLMTPILRAMIMPDREAILQLLLDRAPAEAKIQSMLNAMEDDIAEIPGLQRRVSRLIESLPEDTTFTDAQVREIMSRFYLKFSGYYLKSRSNALVMIDALGDRCPSFLSNRTVVVREMDRNPAIEDHLRQRYNTRFDHRNVIIL